jgi:exodeoxyribonuclease VII small subunit
MASDAAQPENMPLGARLHRLQRIVADLEREDMELEEAMRLFEEGVAHLRAAESLVSATELRIERLLEDGTLAAAEPSDSPDETPPRGQSADRPT